MIYVLGLNWALTTYLLPGMVGLPGSAQFGALLHPRFCGGLAGAPFRIAPLAPHLSVLVRPILSSMGF